MAIKIDKKFLDELGLKTLPETEKQQLLTHIYETLELRVGTKIAAVLREEQLTEFEQYIDSNDAAGAQNWLTQNYPEYPKIVSQELDKLKVEIRTQAPKILSASQNQHP